MFSFRTLFKARTDASQQVTASIESHKADAQVIKAAKKALAAVDLAAKGFGPDFFACRGEDAKIAMYFAVDPHSGRNWEPAVAALVVDELNARRDDHAGYAETRLIPVTTRNACSSVTTVVVAESKDVANTLGNPKDCGIFVGRPFRPGYPNPISMALELAKKA